MSHTELPLEHADVTKNQSTVGVSAKRGYGNIVEGIDESLHEEDVKKNDFTLYYELWNEAFAMCPDLILGVQSLLYE